MAFGWPLALITPILAIGVTAMLLALNMSGPPGSGLNGYGVANPYSWHPVLMCLAFLLFFPLGMLTYIADLGSKANAQFPDRGSRRVLHGVFNMLGAMCCIVGFLVAYVYNEVNGKPHTALSGLTGDKDTKTRPAHAILGYIVVAGMAVQAIVGLWKFVVITRDRQKVAGAHGRTGPIVWLLGLVCICLAAWFEYLEKPPADAPHWSIGQVWAIWIGVIVLAVVVMVHAHIGTKAHLKPTNDVDMDADADNERLVLGGDGYSYAEKARLLAGGLQ